MAILMITQDDCDSLLNNRTPKNEGSPIVLFDLIIQTVRR